MTHTPEREQVSIVDAPDAEDSDSGRLANCDNCSAARSSGAAPLYTGDSGYRSGLDRDGDGVACEN